MVLIKLKSFNYFESLDFDVFRYLQFEFSDHVTGSINFNLNFIKISNLKDLILV